ncbi:MAG: hypothetical protein SGPRY_005153 [Prymnesium sp.]
MRLGELQSTTSYIRLVVLSEGGEQTIRSPPGAVRDLRDHLREEAALVRRVTVLHLQEGIVRGQLVVDHLPWRRVETVEITWESIAKWILELSGSPTHDSGSMRALSVISRCCKRDVRSAICTRLLKQSEEIVELL